MISLRMMRTTRKTAPAARASASQGGSIEPWNQGTTFGRRTSARKAAPIQAPTPSTSCTKPTQEGEYRRYGEHRQNHTIDPGHRARGYSGRAPGVSTRRGGRPRPALAAWLKRLAGAEAGAFGGGAGPGGLGHQEGGEAVRRRLRRAGHLAAHVLQALAGGGVGDGGGQGGGQRGGDLGRGAGRQHDADEGGGAVAGDAGLLDRRHLGRHRQPGGGGDAEDADRALPVEGQRGGDLGHAGIDVAGDEVGRHGAAAAIGDVLHARRRSRH